MLILSALLVATVAVSLLLAFQAKLSAREVVGQTSAMVATALVFYGLVLLL